ncbi:sugar ABC transporter permease [Haploplasma axanthum]|uniref:Maltose transport system permease protein malG n=1 Tax=Haploplasma axanthum TaxID=29552 RepID=A0A449BF99_HAPAX|nr:sugar ABC transporter permease [Haploplasma axanthum]VEU81127.1 Maltose transport system permease protein malG [Haploplasma axanthum]
MTLIILLIVIVVFTALLTQYFGSFEILKIKDLHDTKSKLLTLIPVYGHFYTKKLPFKNREYEQRHYDHIYSGELVSKRIGISFLIVTLITLVLIPISVIFNLSFKNNAMRALLVTFVIILLFLLNQGLTVDFAKKRGYEGTKYGLIGLIPIASFFIINKICVAKKSNLKGRKLIDVFRPKNIIQRILIQGEIALMAIIVIVPVIYIFGMAFSDVQSGVPNTIWPDSPNMNAFKRLFNETKFTTWYKNTLIIAIINMVIGTLIITGASYVFARFKFKGKKAGLLSILVLQAFPSFMGLLAMYILFWKFGLLGKPTALTILYIGGSIPGNIWLIKGFLDQIPKDLDESAMIDGASKVKIFAKIILPLAVPILTFVAVSMFMAPWMDYMLPGYLLNHAPAGSPADYDIQQQWTLAVGIFNFINDTNSLDYSAFAAAALIVGMPIAVLYMAFQKYLIEGIMAGATKG